MILLYLGFLCSYQLPLQKQKFPKQRLYQVDLGGPVVNRIYNPKNLRLEEYKLNEYRNLPEIPEYKPKHGKMEKESQKNYDHKKLKSGNVRKNKGEVGIDKEKRSKRSSSSGVKDHKKMRSSSKYEKDQNENGMKNYIYHIYFFN
jgi:hypothetical protein